MTTIAYKNGVMSFDGKMTLGDTIIKLDTEKAYWVNNHLVGICGRARAINTFVTWLQRMTDYHIINQEVGDLVDLIPPVLEDDEGYTALVITPSKQVLMYEGNTPIDMGNDIPMAVGSGSVYALAAMKAGATAEESVKIACELDVYSGGVVGVVALEEEKEAIDKESAMKMSKEELISKLFPEDNESEEEEECDCPECQAEQCKDLCETLAGELVSLEEQENLLEDSNVLLHSWGEDFVTLEEDSSGQFILSIGGFELDPISGDPSSLVDSGLMLVEQFSVGELQVACESMGVKYTKKNNKSQLAVKIIKKLEEHLEELDEMF